MFPKRTALECTGVGKRFDQGETCEDVLRDVNLTVQVGEACCLLGPSGSGKTTLLSILGCLLTPTTGRLVVDDTAVDFTVTHQVAELRRRRIGFVFQQAHLLPFLSVERNLEVVAENSGMNGIGARQRRGDLLERLGVAAGRRKLPSELSGGQRQRVAVARALLRRPAVVLADEPTAALDWENGQSVMQLLVEEARLEQAALVVVTHDTRLLGFFDRVFRVEGGRLSNA
jgi:putative ABC transport system ATP-binding protein